VGPCGGAAEVYIGFDAGSFSVAFAEVLGKGPGLGIFDQIDRASAEAPSGEARPDAAELFAGEVDQYVGLGTAGFKVIAIAGMCFIHKPAEGSEVASFEGIGGRDGANILGNDVAAAHKNLGGAFRGPSERGRRASHREAA
jgi:hypothetical protein